MLAAAVVAACVALAGCAAPGTPGTGTGASYTPVVDMQGLDMGRYDADLAACRGYSNTTDPRTEAVAGVLMGALLGAAVGATVSSGTPWQRNVTGNTAAFGGTYGGMKAANNSNMKQERIIANCMAGRGYRVLDASVPVNTRAKSPYLDTPDQAASAVPPLTPTQAVSVNPAAYVTPAPKAPEAPRRETGQDTYQAEKLAKTQSCSANPVATLSAKGPGFETYSIPCGNGDTWAVRCEFGNCRVLQ